MARWVVACEVSVASMDPQRGLAFDPLRDYARDPYLRSISGSRDVLGHTPSQQAMALATSLSSGQGFYTVESLEGATSLPLPKPAPPLSLPRPETYPASSALSAEREALLRLNAQTRALFADRESLDARARLLAAEREVLLRAVPGESESRARVLSDGRPPPVDVRGRDGLQPRDARGRVQPDGFQPLDARSRALSDSLQPLDARSRAFIDGLQPREFRAGVFPEGLDGRSRVPPLSGGFALQGQERLPPPDLVPPRELAAALRGGLPPFLSADPLPSVPVPRREGLELRGHQENIQLLGRGGSLELHGRRDNLELRGHGIGHRDNLELLGRGTTQARPDWGLVNGKREVDRGLAEPSENFRVRKQAEKGKPFPTSYPPPQKPPAGKTKPPPEELEGWCAVCKINCFNAKTLAIHVAGKKHKLAIEALKEEKANIGNVGGAAAKTTAQQEAKAVPSEKGATSLADKKRANDEKVEAPQNAKRLKASASADASNAMVKAAADAKKGNGNELHPVCKICNISCTSKINLDSHFKGKRHAARLSELREASSGQK